MGSNIGAQRAIAFAMSQLKKLDALKGLENPSKSSGKRSAESLHVPMPVRAATARSTRTRSLAGLLHGIGQLYILHARRNPACSPNQAAYNGHCRDWHSALQSAARDWGMAEEVIEAVSNFEDLTRSPRARWT